MEIIYLPKFARQYKKLPNNVKVKAEKIEIIFRKNPFDKKLSTHKLHGLLKNFWAISIDKKYRIIFDFLDKHTIRFYSVGSHDIYE